MSLSKATGVPKGSLLSALWTSYLTALVQRPIRTKAITAYLVSLAGNLTAQKAVEGRQNVDWARAAKFALISALFTPITHNWLQFLDSRVTGKAAALKKMLLDQLFFSPFATALFFTLISVLDGRFQDIVPSLSKSYWPTLTTRWKIWPAVQYVNFSFVPPQLRVLYMAAFGFLWNIFLAVMTKKRTGK